MDFLDGKMDLSFFCYNKFLLIVMNLILGVHSVDSKT